MKKINFEDSPSTNTPLSAYVLNTMQDNVEEEINNLSQTLKGVNIKANTVQGYGRMRKLYGNTVDGRSLADNINLFNINDIEQGGISQTTGENDSDTSLIRTKSHQEIKGNTEYIFNLISSSVRIYEYDNNKNFIRTYAITYINNIFTTSENCAYIRMQRGTAFNSKTKLEQGNTVTNFSSYEEGTVEIQSSNADETQTDIMVIQAKPLQKFMDEEGNIQQDYIDFTSGKIVYVCDREQEEIVELNCTDKIVQFADSTTVKCLDEIEAQIEVELTQNSTIAGLNEVDKRNEEQIEKTQRNMEIKQTYEKEIATNDFLADKRIYKKRLQKTLTETSGITFAHGIDINNVKVIDAKGMLYSGNVYFPLPQIRPLGLNYAIGLYVYDTNIVIETAMDRKGYIADIEISYVYK